MYVNLNLLLELLVAFYAFVVIVSFCAVIVIVNFFVAVLIMLVLFSYN